jgi:GNAT superfamily N-acetyltransferase
MIRPLTPSDIPQLLATWNVRWESFPLRRLLWEQQTLGDPAHYRPDLSSNLEDAYIGVKTPPPLPDWQGQDPLKAWISYLVFPAGKTQAAHKLLQKTLLTLKEQGYKVVAYGTDPFHFFPGVPEDPELEQLLVGEGFIPGKTVWDFYCYLGKYSVPAREKAALKRSGLQVESCTVEDIPALLRFLAQNFPGRWYYDTLARLEVEYAPASILLLKDGPVVVGFCHVYHKATRHIGPGVYWQHSENAGGLGPIGISDTLRGNGLGTAFLYAAMAHLESLGVRQLVVDWTDLSGFYRRAGFKPLYVYKGYTAGL